MLSNWLQVFKASSFSSFDNFVTFKNNFVTFILLLRLLILSIFFSSSSFSFSIEFIDSWYKIIAFS